MNLFGKIFTLLIFFLSITFLVLAVMVGASHRNWKEVARVNAEKARNTQNRLEESKTASGEAQKKLRAEMVARQQQLSQLFSELELAKTRLEDESSLLRAATEQVAQLSAELKVAQSRLVAQDKDVDDLNGRNKQLIDEIAAKRALVVAMTNQQYRLEGELDQLNEMRESMAGQIGQMTRVLNANGLTPNSLTDGIPRPVEGIVTRHDDGFIAISVGTDDGVRNDHMIDIYRGKKYVGRATVTNAEHNRSAARLLPEYTQSVVREGDYVTTKF